jgi:hypothetical protein
MVFLDRHSSATIPLGRFAYPEVRVISRDEAVHFFWRDANESSGRVVHERIRGRDARTHEGFAELEAAAYRHLGETLTM